MTDDDDIEAQLAALTERLEAVQAELERTQRRRPLLPPPPSMDELRRFGSEVAIPGAILLLETNVRALKLLQRTLRAAEERERAGERASAVSEQASAAGVAALARLEDALTDVQAALEGQPTDSEARELLEEARTLREDIESQLDQDAESVETGPEVDVEAELKSIKDQMNDDDEE